ncbi:hypothetical protein ACLK17_14925 [Escherichia coli]
MKRTMLYLSLLAVSCSVSAAKYPVLTESSPEKAGERVKRLEEGDWGVSGQGVAGVQRRRIHVTDNENQSVEAAGRGEEERGLGAGGRDSHRDHRGAGVQQAPTPK